MGCADAERGDALFGTPDTWVLWNLTGGALGGCITDVTNASRTMLMNLGRWTGRGLLSFFGIPRAMLRTSGRRPHRALRYGAPGRSDRRPVPVTASLGDQRAAMVGQVCLAPGEAKNTYGTGNFLLLQLKIVRSDNGLLTTVCYQFGNAKPVYALEVSIAVTGSAVQWLRDQLGIISGAAQERDAGRRGRGQRRCVLRARPSPGLFAPTLAVRRPRTSSGCRASTQCARGPGDAGRRSATRAAMWSMRWRPTRCAPRVLKVGGGVTLNELCIRSGRCAGRRRGAPVVAERRRSGRRTRRAWRPGSGRIPMTCGNWQEMPAVVAVVERRSSAPGLHGWRKAVAAHAGLGEGRRPRPSQLLGYPDSPRIW